MLKTMLTRAVLTLCLTAVAVQAQALDFDYTTGASNDIFVAGKIYGLKNNATSVPTDMTMTSYPTNLLDSFTHYGSTIDMQGWTVGAAYEFTVLNNVVTKGEVELTDPKSPNAFFSFSFSNRDKIIWGIIPAVTCLSLDTTHLLIGMCGFDGEITLAPSSPVTEVPEPLSLTILGTGLVALALLKARSALHRLIMTRNT